MKNLFLLILFLSCALAPALADSDKILDDARKKITNGSHIVYTQKALYPNPIGKVDTLKTTVTAERRLETEDEFNYRFVTEDMDETIMNGEARLINHKEKVVNFFAVPNNNRDYIQNHRNVAFSPITLLEKDWTGVSDTLLEKKGIFHFTLVDSDTVVNGNSILTEFHIFVNGRTHLLERFERRNYFKGDLSQTVVYEYTDYVLGNSHQNIVIQAPQHYVSEPFEKTAARKILESGSQAPSFSSFALSGDLFELDSFRGKKILLMFSTINCEYSHQALEQLTHPDFKLDDKIAVIQINPFDSEP